MKRLESLFFYPDAIDYGGHPENEGYELETLAIPSQGAVLHGWYVKSPVEPKATIVHFHGNAGNVTNHWGYVAALPQLGFDVVTFDYRGYGKSTGKPDFQGVYDDCCAVLQECSLRQPRKIVLAQSIGGAFASCAVAAHPQGVVGFVIDSSFNSFRDVAAATLRLPFASIITKALVSNRFKPETCIAKISAPKLFIHAVGDMIVPFALGQKLYSAASEPKKLITLQESSHIAFFSNSSQYQEFLDFAQEVS